MAPRTTSRPSLFALPACVRQRVYTYLLAPHPDDDVTTINYSLSWNWLENPSNTTFAGVQQIDRCRCPQQQPRKRNIKTEDHIYSRYKCYGPEVRFKSSREDLWVLSPAYVRSGQINFLRPALKHELERRPHASILSTCKTIYEEAVPILYQDRNFLFLTGPCPRGRYQAYATQTFLARLTPLARSHVTTLSILAQKYEEDCSVKDVGGAYANLAAHIQLCLPSFKTLCLNVWDDSLRDAARMFRGVFDGDGITVCLTMDTVNGRMSECQDAKGFEKALEGTVKLKEQKVWARDDNSRGNDSDQVVVRENTALTLEQRIENGKRRQKSPLVKKQRPNWEEVQDEDQGETDVPKHEDVTDHVTDRAPEVRTNLMLRKGSTVQRVISKSRGKTKAKEGEEEGREGDDEWVDATLSPTSAGNNEDVEGWEIL